MRTLVLAAACVALILACSIACSIDRASEALECATNDDCTSFDGNRVCEGGYCVVSPCPADCTSCNATARTCMVECSSPTDCDSTISCPSGWTCTVVCNGDSACEDVVCSSGSRCNVSCNGPGSCDDVDCGAACQCDVACAAGACESMVCPIRGNGANQVRCTEDGTTTTQCDSAHAASCANC